MTQPQSVTSLAPGFEPVEIPAKYAKAIIAILTAVLTVLVAAMADNRVTQAELVSIAIAFLTAFAVYAIPNFDQNAKAYLKVIVAFVGTGLQALYPLISEGTVSNQQWLIVFLAAIGALAVGIVPNADPEKIAAQTTIVNVATVDQIDNAESPRHLATAEVPQKGVAPETGGI